MQDMSEQNATSLASDLGLRGSDPWLEAIDWDRVVWLILTFTVPEQPPRAGSVSQR